MAGVACAFSAMITPMGILADETVVDIAGWLPGVPAVIGNGLIPTAGVLAGICIVYFLFKRKFSATNNEAVQAIFVFILVAFLIMTATGIWFRGEGMRLVWPI
jgi:hypothetical protein